MGRLGSAHGTTQRATLVPSPRELEWAAGFLEGEGSFSSNGVGAGKQMVHAGQKHNEPLLRLQQMFGGRVYARPNTKFGTTDRVAGAPLWCWYVCGARARGVMLTLISLLSSRRRAQILTAMKVGAR